MRGRETDHRERRETQRIKNRNGRQVPQEKAEKKLLQGKAEKKPEKRSEKKSEKKIEKTETACPLFQKCGSCKYLDLSYEEQLQRKYKEVRQLMEKHGKVMPAIGMEEPYHYRNKVHAVFDRDRKGNPISGVYRERSHEVLPVESCLIEDRLADQIVGTIRGMLKSFKIKVYDEDTGYGLLRYVLVRRGLQTGEVMVVLVTASPVFPSKRNFTDALRKAHPEITTVVQNVNTRSDSMILGERNQVLYGKGYIEDILCGCRFRISPASFYQINPIQTEKLYAKAIELAGLSGKETVVDAYCGIGTIGLIASGKAKQVIAVEQNPAAVHDAIRNSKLNGIKNVRFYQDDAGHFLESMAADEMRADVILMDPPRAGSSEAFLDSAAVMNPEKIVYISCNPVTLERDVTYLEKKGYRMREVWPVDMFPWTGSIETVVLLSHKKADSYIHVDIEFGEGEGKIPVDKIVQRAEKYKPKEKVTYKKIKEYIAEKYRFQVHTAYIAEVKRSLGLPMYDAPNAVEELKQPRKHPTQEKVEAIKDALRYFAVI